MADQSSPKSSPCRLFLFHGAESYLTHEKIKYWQQKFAEKHDAINITIFDGRETSASEIIRGSETMPFLSEKRLLIIKNIFSEGDDQTQKELSSSLENISDWCVLVFTENKAVDKRLTLYKKILKIGQVEEFTPLAGDQLISWIKKEAEKNKGKISLPVANYLAITASSDLWKLKNEIDKLCLYAKNREITIEDIDLLTSGSLNTNIFKLTDALSQKNSRESLKILHNLLKYNEDLFMIFHMIIRQFRILIQIKDLLDQKKDLKTIIEILKMHPFVIKNTAAQSRNFSFEQLKDIYEKLLTLETGLKTGKIKISTDDEREFELALDKFIVDCTR